MKKAFTTIAIMALFVMGMIGVGVVVEPNTALHQIETSSPCPVTGCASGNCHGFGDVPIPDGIHEMLCPEATCSSVECHAWDSLIGRYHQASDASLNVWILMPVVLVVALIVMIRMLSKKNPADETEEDYSVKGDDHE